MFFKKQIANSTCTSGNIAENIRRDLVASLQKKGVDISKIHIGMESGKLNVKVQIIEK
ncbi:hypothetical protein V6C42_14185 [Pseudoclostridium thermosuccinogenes]|jgi:hypothetical protein|uniref:hypothetical protein n=1 Tax=Clostridium thermosuccinogenes TaxID=84032 RepID=UPI001374833D|nr:hypothetical protein [Pseudoclostridium thermosuccinogenes]